MVRKKINLVRPELIAAIIAVESDGKDDAIGDTGLEHKAYGPLQIRQPYVQDVNELFGTSYNAQDCLNNRELSIEIMQRYMQRYATVKRLKRIATDEDIARIHNGGPSGLWRASTIPYWIKVRAALAVE